MDNIEEIQNQIEHLKDVIRSNSDQLFDAEDPMEPDILFPEEEKRIKDEIIKCDNKITNLERKQMNIIVQLYPQIKESTLINEIESHKIKYLIYVLVYKCPKLLQNENNIKIILSYIMQKDAGWAFYDPSKRKERIRTINRLSSSTLMDENLNLYLSCKNLDQFQQVLTSDILMQDKEFKKLLIAYIENKSTDYIFHIKTMENILKKFPHISRKFLFYPEKYLLKHIEDSKILRYLSLMRKMYSNQSLTLECGSILKRIFDTYNGEYYYIKDIDLKELFIKCNNKIDKLKISILLNLRDKDIIQHTIDILYNLDFECPSYEVTPTLIIALLKAANIHNQDILINFLDEEEIRRTILNQNNFYYHFLIEKINQEEYGTITSMFDLQEDDANIIEKLKCYFDQLETKYIYFTMYDKKTHKTPRTFYQQFIKNALSKTENYLSQCLNENQQENFFCNGRIIFDIIDKEYICLGEDILKFGMDRPLNYDLNEEIYWNMLCINASKEIEREELYPPSYELIRTLYLKEENKKH